MSKDYGLNCPMCKRSMYYSYKLIGPSSKPSSGKRGYVKGTITYMVSDNLVVEPLTSIIGILHNKFNVKDIGALDEKVVDLDMDVGLKLLKVSLQLKSIPTDVFLPMLKNEVKMEK
ncbi:hypothetical protein SO802_020727 [Lithocarpus litseifolius]|uniref:Uncharacterized protein n=1 Tax=Lithocarpus litseifolius TaxID=425828 RepID=A0AAW2CDX2_9ROSI